MAGKQALLRLKKVQEQVDMGRTSIYESIKIGAFPKPIPLGKLSGKSKKPNGHAVRWLASDIDEWIESRIKAAQ